MAWSVQVRNANHRHWTAVLQPQRHHALRAADRGGHRRPLSTFARTAVTRPIMSTGQRVLITRRLPDSVLDKIRKQLPGVTLAMHHAEQEAMAREEMERALRQGVDAVVCVIGDRIDAPLLQCDAERRLKVVATVSVGYNHIDVAACRARGIAVGHTPDVLTDTTADLAVGLLLATARRFREALQAVETPGAWASSWSLEWLCGADVHHKTVGIVGLGRIGAAVAHRLHHGFGCHILYHGRRDKPQEAAALGPAEFVASLPQLLQRSDFVLPFCPLTPETYHLFGADLFAHMKPSAMLINVSRGEIVNHDDLIQALERRQLAAYGADVTEPEPFPADHPLLRRSNVTILPHIGSASHATRAAMAAMTVDNVVAGLRGLPLPHAVDAGGNT